MMMTKIGMLRTSTSTTVWRAVLGDGVVAVLPSLQGRTWVVINAVAAEEEEVVDMMPTMDTMAD